MFIFPNWGFAKEDNTQKLVIPNEEYCEILTEAVNEYFKKEEKEEGKPVKIYIGDSVKAAR